MKDEHIKVVAPIILGDHIYDQFAVKYYRNRVAFGEHVETRYGLSRK